MTSVSLDEELALLLDLEQSYKASAKLVAAVDEMITAPTGGRLSHEGFLRFQIFLQERRMRLTVSKAQKEMVAQEETVVGHADVGATLGAKTARTLNLHRDLQRRNR